MRTRALECIERCGGIRTVEDIRRMLNSGADKVSLNSAAVRDPELIREGRQRKDRIYERVLKKLQ